MAWAPIKLRKGGDVTFVGEAEGGGGGSQLLRVFTFAFNTPGLAVQTFPITAVDQGAQTFTIAGNHATLFPVGAFLNVVGSTRNDSNYTVASVAVAGGATVVETVEAPADGTADGTLSNGGTAGIVLATADAYLGDVLNVTVPFDGVDGPTLYLVQQNQADPIADSIGSADPSIARCGAMGVSPFGGQLQLGTAPLVVLLTTNDFTNPGSSQGEATLLLALL